MHRQDCLRAWWRCRGGKDEITAAVVTGMTNATAQSLNRLAKLEARQAYGFRNPLNQQRRVRIACTRGYRRRSYTATPGGHIR
jgi:hypothetical protein